MESNDVHSSPSSDKSPDESVVIPDMTSPEAPENDLNEPTAPEAAAPTIEPTTKLDRTKKSNKLPLIAGAVVLVLLVATGVVYFLHNNDDSKTASEVKTSSQSTTATKATPLTTAVDQAANSITGSATSESNLTSTDDSSAASDATNSAASVGDSVDENSF